MEKCFQLSNVEKNRHESSYNSQDEYPINPLHTDTLLSCGSLELRFGGLSAVRVRKKGQQQAKIHLSVPECAVLLSLSLWPSPLPFSTRPGPLSLYLALQVGKGDITLLMFLSLKKPHLLKPWLPPLSVPDSCILQTTRSKTFPLLWQLKFVPEQLSYNPSISLLATNLCLMPSLSSNPHTPLSYLTSSLKAE